MNDVVGVDTNWLVAIAVVDHPNHALAEQAWFDAIDEGGEIGLVPQVLSEFVHVVTDTRRFGQPCSMDAALTLAANWWNATEIRQLFPTAASVQLGWDWMRQHRLGRKRVLDTQLAATLFAHGVRRILTANPRDYVVFGVFDNLDGATNDTTKA